MENSTPKPTYLRDYKVPDYLIETVDLEFTLDEDFTLVKSRLRVCVNSVVHYPDKNLNLQGEMLELISVTLDDNKLHDTHYKATTNTLTIFQVPSRFTLEIHTRIKPQENTALSGLYKSRGNFCTQCEAEGFRRITYFLDRPDVMARYTTKIIANKEKYPVLLSNGNLTASGNLTQGNHWVKWEDPFKKPCYLFALVAGNLECVEDSYMTSSGKRITLRIYVEKGNSDKCAHAMYSLKKAMRWDEEKFGREYDLNIYMIVAVSDFNMGAMENKGLNIFNTQYILAKPETATDMDYIYVESVIAHEYFHNWTGNRITCRDWFQLSLKEGLTIFRDQSFTEDRISKAVARINDVNDLRNTQFPEDAGPLAHPVRPESYIEISNFYTATVYNKGAEVIRMMQTLLGEKLFLKGMNLYFARHDGQAVTIEEFVKAMEDAAKINLIQFRLWYSQAGTPLLEVRDHYHAKHKLYTLTIKQTCPATPGQPEKKPFHIPIKVGLLDESGQEIAHDLLQLKQAEQSFIFKNISAHPIPSLLRHFSAPVKVHYIYSTAKLRVLFEHDTDSFNRWEAGQQYTINLILRLIKSFCAKKPLIVSPNYIKALENVLLTSQKDKLLLAEMLTLPSENYLAEQMPVVNVEAIHSIREFVLTQIAKQLKSIFLELYHHNHHSKSKSEFDIQEIGMRQLKNLCLHYLMQLDDPDIQQNIAMHQFEEALSHNMTNTLAALRCLVNTECTQRKIALNAFYKKWHHDPLVVNKWFALQATSKLPNTLAQVKELTQHAAFDIKNPNNVYALIGAFCQRNIVRFHVISGEGYEFLAEHVLRLNKLNPQIAARMVRPLIDWRRFDADRQQLMRQQLKRIAEERNLSTDVYELVNKSLSE